MTLRHEVAILSAHLGNIRKRQFVHHAIFDHTYQVPLSDRRRSGKHLEEKFIQEDIYTPYQIRYSPLSRRVLNTHIPIDYNATKMTLENYDGLTDPMKHV